MKRQASKQLHIIMTLSEHPPRRLSRRGKRFGQQIIKLINLPAADAEQGEQG